MPQFLAASPPFVVSKYAESPTGYKHDHSEIDASQERPGRMQQNRVQQRINGPMFFDDLPPFDSFRRPRQSRYLTPHYLHQAPGTTLLIEL